MINFSVTRMCVLTSSTVCHGATLLRNDASYMMLLTSLSSLAGAQGPVNIKTIFPRYGDSHVKDKMVMRPSYLWYGDPYTGKTTSLYWAGPLVCCMLSNQQLHVFEISWTCYLLELVNRNSKFDIFSSKSAFESLVSNFRPCLSLACEWI